MIKKWGLALMLLALLAAPMLACGFPLPAGTSMMAVSKAVCAEDEPVESCNLRRDAYQMMGKLSAASITDLQVELYIDDGSEVTTANLTGSFDYVVSESAEYLGANVSATLDDAVVTSASGTDDLSNAAFRIIDGIGYTSNDGGETWIEEELDSTALLGLSFLLGLSGTQGANLDMFGNPGTFTVVEGPTAEHMGQEMIVQTLTVDLSALLGNPDAVLALFEDAESMGLEAYGIDVAELGDPNQFAMIASMLLPFLEGTQVSATLWIGADDGYIHYIDETYALYMDLSATDPTASPVEMNYTLKGFISNHNADLVIEVPMNAQEGEGGLFDGGLSGSLFGN